MILGEGRTFEHLRRRRCFPPSSRGRLSPRMKWGGLATREHSTARTDVQNVEHAMPDHHACARCAAECSVHSGYVARHGFSYLRGDVSQDRLYILRPERMINEPQGQLSLYVLRAAIAMLSVSVEHAENHRVRGVVYLNQSGILVPSIGVAWRNAILA